MTFELDHAVPMIAHRLSTIVSAEMICVIEAGWIVVRGSYPELLSRPAADRSLCEQLTGSIGSAR